MQAAEIRDLLERQAVLSTSQTAVALGISGFWSTAMVVFSR
jgi:hypothetical protein